VAAVTQLPPFVVIDGGASRIDIRMAEIPMGDNLEVRVKRIDLPNDILEFDLFM
jgi:uncharacterized protein YpmS